MELFFATDDYKINGVSYEGFPILVDSNLDFVEEAHAFLFYECIKRGRVQSKKSWIVYGQSMYDYFGFLEANNLDWWAISAYQSPLVSYRDWSISELGLSNTTVNSRLRVINRFYHFAYNNGWIKHLPFDMEEIRVRPKKTFLIHTQKNPQQKQSPDIYLKNKPTAIKILSKSQVKTLLEAIGNPTHKLITKLALSTGLRREELVTFPVSYIVNTSQHKIYQEFIRVTLNPNDMETKGSKSRQIDISMKLLSDLQHYVIHERSKLEAICGTQQSCLFLTQKGQPWANSGLGLNQLYKRLNLPFTVTPHMLRHTYATHTLFGLRELKSRVDPLLYVRDRLGHSSLTTTEQYLHLLSDLEDELMAQYQKEIDSII